MSVGRLSAERHNRIVEQAVDRSLARQKMIAGEMMASGYPPGTMPRSPYQQYMELVAAQQAGDPRYWGDPNAQAQLALLSQRFGQPSPFTQPFGVSTPNNPLGQARAAARFGVPTSEPAP